MMRAGWTYENGLARRKGRNEKERSPKEGIGPAYSFLSKGIKLI